MSRCVLLLLSLSIFACGPEPTEPPPGMQVVHTYYCYATPAAAWGATALIHRVTEFSDGSLFAECEVGMSDFGTSSSAFFAPGSKGARTADCIIFTDVDASSFGFWGFTKPLSQSAGRATYHDDASPYNNTSYTTTCKAGAP